MKQVIILVCLAICVPSRLPSQSSALFDDIKIASIYVELPAAAFTYMLDNLVNDQYTQARFIFDDGQHRDTVEQVGLRLRGNTSLSAFKKSFKISFNEYVPGREYQGVRKLNLNGEHNDPTMIREKLFYEVWKKAGMPERRSSFVKVYVNQVYRGLYTNIEEIDKQWLTRVYGQNDGNLYKCTYPADLVYLGPGQMAYKALLNNPTTRAYDLTTNEPTDDYTRLVALITALDQPENAGFPAQLEPILNVQGVLKAFAIDVATGNWDDYFFNKNNYYLYDNPVTGRFEFVTYDTDNTFGVDWTGQDWAKRDALAWQNPVEPRPLATKLLAVPAYREQFVHYLDTITRLITLPDSIFTRIEVMHGVIIPAATADNFRTLDFGYDMADFHAGFNQTVDGHTPYGIKPFLQQRQISTIEQIAGELTGTQLIADGMPLQVYPNPFAEELLIRTDAGSPVIGTLYDISGKPVAQKVWSASEKAFSWLLPGLLPGYYVLQVGTQSIPVFKD